MKCYRCGSWPCECRDSVTIINADCREALAALPDESVQCCVTSPPYWGLRDYGVDGQLGLESTPEEFVAGMTGVFEEVRRVLRGDGTLWLNLGDSYNAGTSTNRNPSGNHGGDGYGKHGYWTNPAINKRVHAPALKPKDLCGIPWRVAFALQADGWYLRQDIIWHKPNPMPESVTDRCTKAHEYLFLLAKSERYEFDAEAVKEDSVDPEGSAKRYKAPFFCGDKHESGGYSPNGAKHTAGMKEFNGTRNRRSVWSVTTNPYPGAHFATFPPKLIEPCILAGCPEGGVVLDPFFGSGTTGEVCRNLGRKCIGIELNPAYCELAKKRFIQEVLF